MQDDARWCKMMQDDDDDEDDPMILNNRAKMQDARCKMQDDAR